MSKCTKTQLWCRLVARARAPANCHEQGAFLAMDSEGKGHMASKSLVAWRTSFPGMVGSSGIACVWRALFPASAAQIKAEKRSLWSSHIAARRLKLCALLRAGTCRNRPLLLTCLICCFNRGCGLSKKRIEPNETTPYTLNSTNVCSATKVFGSWTVLQPWHGLL